MLTAACTGSQRFTQHTYHLWQSSSPAPTLGSRPRQSHAERLPAENRLVCQVLPTGQHLIWAKQSYKPGSDHTQLGCPWQAALSGQAQHLSGCSTAHLEGQLLCQRCCRVLEHSQCSCGAIQLWRLWR